MDYGRHLISKVVADGTLKEANTLGVTLEHFVAPNDRIVWETIVDHHQQYGNVPKLSTLRADFPEYKFIKVEEPMDFLAARVLHAYKGATLSTLLGAAVEYYDDDEFDTVEKFLAAGLRALASSGGSFMRPLDVEALLAKWKIYRDNPPEGVPYGLAALDEESRGMQDDDFVVLAGPPGSGKSALMLNFGIAAVKKKKKIVFVTIEMSDGHHMYRLAANVTQIPFKQIKFGPLSAREGERVDATVRAIVADGRFVIQQLDPTSANLGAIEALIEQHHPDVVYIDGAYLMDLPGVRKDAPQWERLSALTREMRALVLRSGIPICISTQILESKMQGGQVTAASVGYSSSFHQDASVMIGIQPDGELDDRQIVKILKMRDAPKMSLHLKWDWKTFSFTLPEFEEVEY